MSVFGYARVSTTGQDLSIQEAALQAAGCETISIREGHRDDASGQKAQANSLRFHLPRAEELTGVYVIAVALKLPVGE